MKTLFLRIFILCWITNVVVISALVLLASQTNLLPKPEHRFWDDRLGIIGCSAVSVVEHGGKTALKDYLNNLQRTTGSTAYIVNNEGQELLDRPLPPSARQVVQQINEKDAIGSDSPLHGLWAGRLVYGSEGHRYVTLIELKKPPSNSVFRVPGPLVMPMLVVVITAGAIAFVLAYYVTSPVRKLRVATQRFAAGNWAARVGPAVARRRDAIGELGREFDVMASRIQSLIIAQRRLLQDVSHELRSPLARLNVALGIASSKAGPGAQDALTRIEHEAIQLNELIGQLLTLSRLESNQVDTERSEIDLTAVVDVVVEDANFETKQKERKVRIVRREVCLVSGVESLLRSAVENVLRNAISYTAPGTNVDVEVFHRSENNVDFAVVSVKDRGPGIPSEHLESIFRPFHRVEDARDRHRGGVGLGLAIAARAIGIHGGNIIAANAPEGGLIVEISLPLTILCEHDKMEKKQDNMSDK